MLGDNPTKTRAARRTKEGQRAKKKKSPEKKKKTSNADSNSSNGGEPEQGTPTRSSSARTPKPQKSKGNSRKRPAATPRRAATRTSPSAGSPSAGSPSAASPTVKGWITPCARPFEMNLRWSLDSSHSAHVLFLGAPWALGALPGARLSLGGHPTTQQVTSLKYPGVPEEGEKRPPLYYGPFSNR